MKNLYLLLATAILASACTFTSQENTVKGDFHPPLVLQHWNTEYYKTQNSSKNCAVSSGSNGISVMLNSENMVIKSNRMVVAGGSLIVSVAGKRFETYEDYFPDNLTHDLFDSLTKGDKIYIEWTEFSGYKGGGRIHFQNIVQLDDFKSSIQDCMSFVK